MWSRPWRRRGKTAASRSMTGNHRNCGGQVIHSLPAAGFRARLWSAMNNLGHGIMWSAEGNRASNTLTGADGLYNGRSISRQNQPPITNSVEFQLGSATSNRLGFFWTETSSLVKWIGRRECAAFFKAGLFTIRNGARGERRCARGELKTFRPRGRDTRTLFGGVKGKKSVLVSR
jgi:hypothetical protein